MQITKVPCRLVGARVLAPRAHARAVLVQQERRGEHEQRDAAEDAARGADAEVVEEGGAEDGEGGADAGPEEVVAREDGGDVAGVAIW